MSNPFLLLQGQSGVASGASREVGRGRACGGPGVQLLQGAALHETAQPNSYCLPGCYASPACHLRLWSSASHCRLYGMAREATTMPMWTAGLCTQRPSAPIPSW